MEQGRLGLIGLLQTWGGLDQLLPCPKIVSITKLIRLVLEQKYRTTRFKGELRSSLTSEPSTSYPKGRSRKQSYNSVADQNRSLPESLIPLSPKQFWSVSFLRNSRLWFLITTLKRATQSNTSGIFGTRWWSIPAMTLSCAWPFSPAWKVRLQTGSTHCR